MKIAFIRLMLITHKDDEWDKFLSFTNINDGSAYKLYKKLLNRPTPNHLLAGALGPFYSANDKAETFADTYERQFVTNRGVALLEVDRCV